MRLDSIDLCTMEALPLHSGHHCTAHVPQSPHNEAWYCARLPLKLMRKSATVVPYCTEQRSHPLLQAVDQRAGVCMKRVGGRVVAW